MVDIATTEYGRGETIERLDIVYEKVEPVLGRLSIGRSPVQLQHAA
jgi:hypothetical protein